jgi:hypothetical protein
MQSSSNRGVRPCDAVVIQDHRPAGPIRLPDHRADDFVAHFNRTYQGLEMSLALVAEPDPNEKIPGNPKAAGDHDSG